MQTLPPHSGESTNESWNWLWRRQDGWAAREVRHDLSPALLEEWFNRALLRQYLPGAQPPLWLVLGGRGAGKTRLGAEWVNALARQMPPFEIGSVPVMLVAVSAWVCPVAAASMFVRALLCWVLFSPWVAVSVRTRLLRAVVTVVAKAGSDPSASASSLSVSRAPGAPLSTPFTAATMADSILVPEYVVDVLGVVSLMETPPPAAASAMPFTSLMAETMLVFDVVVSDARAPILV